LRCSGGTFAAGEEGAVAVRQHAIRLCASKPDSPDNVVAGTVARQVFLGASRDYLVEAADGTQLRVVAPAAENIARGASVWLHLPPERCRVLSG
jgi:iron(III) transport system ATP-binding protein